MEILIGLILSKKIWVDSEKLYVDNDHYTYNYLLSDIEDYNIREYSSEGIYDYKGGNL